MARFLVIFLFLVGGCIQHIPIAPAIQVREGYSFKQIQSKAFLVWAISPSAMERAKKEIGCGICSEAPLGFVEIIERLSKRN